MVRVAGHFIIILMLSFTLTSCSGNGGGTAIFGDPKDAAPINLFDKRQVAAAGEIAIELRSAKATINEAKLKKAIYRYRLGVGIDSGSIRFVGVDLNNDGTGEALVYFEGDEWCISTGCRLVVFSQRGNGFRKMSVIKRVKLPVIIGSTSSEGWRDLIVNSGNKGIGERLVPLRFKGNYPPNATTVDEKLTELPLSSETVLETGNVAVQLN